MNSLLLAIDQGTTGTKVLLSDENATVIEDFTEEFDQSYPKPGWVEHDLDQIWKTVLKGIKAVTDAQEPRKIAAIGITNQRETICFWSRSTGSPLAPAIVWQDRRTASQCQALKNQGLEKTIQEKTGLLLDPYFSATKIAWALENWGVVERALKSGDLAMGTIESYLISRLTQGKGHFTEPSNASRTLCYDLKKGAWDEELTKIFKVPIECLPTIKPSIGEFAKTKGVEGLPDGIPVTGVLGDQQSALMGQTCFQEGQAKCTYGTGAFLLLNTGSTPVYSRHKLLTTVAWRDQNHEDTFALEGSTFIAGAAVQWLRDGLKMIKTAKEVEALALEVESSEGVVVVPCFTGLSAPYWDPEARASITGITRGTTRAHIARATLEGIALQNTDLLTAMKKDLKKPLLTLNVDGGAAANDFLMQFQSDVLDVKLVRPKYLGTTSMGAIFAAGLGCGLWKDFEAVKQAWEKDQDFEPKMTSKERQDTLAQWDLAIRRTRLR